MNTKFKGLTIIAAIAATAFGLTTCSPAQELASKAPLYHNAKEVCDKLGGQGGMASKPDYAACRSIPGMDSYESVFISMNTSESQYRAFADFNTFSGINSVVTFRMDGLYAEYVTLASSDDENLYKASEKLGFIE